MIDFVYGATLKSVKSRSCARHELGYIIMKKIIYLVSAIVVLTVVTIGLCSFTSQHKVTSEMTCQGKHCTYTVGCDCPGFAPITSGDVWEESYCKHCKHHKKYHK